MKVKTRGIVLHTTQYSETSLVAKIYTEDHGLQSFIVGGVRTKNSRIKSNIFQPLSLVELIASGKQGNTMLRITEIQLSPHFTGIPSNIVKSSIAIFLAEIIYRSINEEEPNPSMFGFIHSGIQILDVCPHNCSRFHIHFMIQLSRYIGFYPNGKFVNRTGLFDMREGSFTDRLPPHLDYLENQYASLLWDFMNSTFENFHDISITRETAQSLLNSIVYYYEMHLTHGKTIHSHKVLAEVLG
jgi:DNA repair protein RecO (recombination protein O)